jgi:protease-4
MFSRKHPFLFSLLIMALLATLSVVSLAAVAAIALKRADFSEFVAEPGGEKVGVVEIKGVITESKDTIALIKRFREDRAIKAIVIRIDSPGGVVGPSQEIFREVRKTIGKKKVVASMGSIAASGGYYIAAAADGIVANPGTITGSIGVIMAYTNFRKLLDKIGMVPVVIKSGEFKDIGSPTREMTPDEKKVLQTFVDQTHRQFVQAVSEGRKMDMAHTASLADGRIFTGEEAVKQGLVDRLGNLEDAVEWAGRLGGIEGKISTVYKKEDKFTFFKYLTESAVKKIMDHWFGPDIQGAYLYRPSDTASQTQ